MLIIIGLTFDFRELPFWSRVRTTEGSTGWFSCNRLIKNDIISLCCYNVVTVALYTSGPSTGCLPSAPTDMSVDLATSASMTLNSCNSPRFRCLRPPPPAAVWLSMCFMNGSSAAAPASSSTHHWQVILASSPTLTVWWTISNVKNDTANSMPGTVTPTISSHHVLFKSKRASAMCESFCIKNNNNNAGVNHCE